MLVATASRDADPSRPRPKRPEVMITTAATGTGVPELLVALDRAVLLLHTPPCDTPLDRAALDGKTYENVPLDVHVGSIAVKRFIEERQPLLTLHGHIHESARLSGEWKIRIGRTVSINGAHDGPELALVRFDLESPESATRELL